MLIVFGISFGFQKANGFPLAPLIEFKQKYEGTHQLSIYNESLTILKSLIKIKLIKKWRYYLKFYEGTCPNVHPCYFQIL